MGRKIPGAKHHGVKDPVKQQEKRMKSLKNKINAPPTNPDDQPMPKSLTRLLEYKVKQEQRLTTKKKNNKKIPKTREDVLRGPTNPVASLSRLPGETGRSFNQRINSAMQGITKRAQHTREMERSLHPDNYLPEGDAREERFNYIESKKLKRKLKSEKAQKAEHKETQTSKLSRMQRWSLKKKEKKSEKQEEADESLFKPKYEQVMFGEVAHEPPTLHIKPKKAKSSEGAPRPGQRDLLLNKLLKKVPTEKSNPPSPRITVSDKISAVDKKAKRRTLPVGVRMRLEQSQKEAIEAYRAIKASSGKGASVKRLNRV